MSRLDALIKEHCPDGVEYLPLNRISIMKRGNTITKNSIIEGDIPVISGGMKPAYYCNKYNREGFNITVAGSGANAGYIQYWDKPIFVSDAFSICGIDGYSTKYLYYCLTNIQNIIYSKKKGSGVPHVHISSIENIDIPAPPLPVQEEIVRILDKFTELAAELAAREKQYEYYKNILFNLSENTEYYLFGDVSKIQRGASPRPINKYLSDEGVSWIKIGDTQLNCKYVNNTKQKITEDGANKSRVLKKGSLIMSNSMSYGRPYILNIDGAIHDGWAAITEYENDYLVDFLYHYLSCEYVKQYWDSKINSSSVSNLNSEIIKSLKVPSISIIEQQRIVDILDRFDTLCNDISSGLPAEIEARQKQYEYYRNKLLTFNKKVNLY